MTKQISEAESELLNVTEIGPFVEIEAKEMSGFRKLIWGAHHNMRLISSLQLPIVNGSGRFFAIRKCHSWMLHGDGDALLNGVHIFQCPDQPGITAKLADCIASRRGNLINAEVFVSREKQLFQCRSEFVYDPLQWPREVMDKDFMKLANAFNANRSMLRVPNIDPKFKIAILVSRQEHCLIDLLHGLQQGRFPVQVNCVISNHKRELNTHVVQFLERLGIPYHYLPISKEKKREEEILNLVADTDFLVLARYMQVLSGDFLNNYGKDVINIHHGLLPSFKGGNPFKQAFDAGVKLIGATCHFVTAELDAGPIIKQMVESITHRDTLVSFAQKSENLEKQCLSKAVKYYCELRVLRFGEKKTIVFDD